MGIRSDDAMRAEIPETVLTCMATKTYPRYHSDNYLTASK